MLRHCLLLVAVSMLVACGAEGTKPEAPHLDAVEPMDGVLHVAWSEPAPCDTVEAEREDGRGAAFAFAFDIAGDETSHMDGDASRNVLYTYRLRCKVGSVFSDYSNQLSANPTSMGP